jgi:hypothetical protein
VPCSGLEPPADGSGVIFETAVAAAVLWIRLARGSWREPAARTGRETEAADAADKPSSS